jgi:hypothetical protein
MEKICAGLDLHPRTEIAPQFDGDPRQERNVVDGLGVADSEKPDGGGSVGLLNLIDNWEEECCRSTPNGFGRRKSPFDGDVLSQIAKTGSWFAALQQCKYAYLNARRRFHVLVSMALLTDLRVSCRLSG